jgi:hypothetical protein
MAVPMARRRTVLSRGHGTPVGARETGAGRFIDELFDLEQGGTEGEHPRAGLARRQAEQAGAARPGARTPRGRARLGRRASSDALRLGARAGGTARRGRIVFLCPYLNTRKSKKLNRSAQSGE